MRTAAVMESVGFVSRFVAPVSRAERQLRPAPTERPPSHIHLTPRQRDVLALLCEGLPNKLICRRLDISSGTVKAHISSILRELGVDSRLQAVVAAREMNLLGAEYDDSE
jgi:DNA-binding NarL/FixJ family response regulator